MKLNSGRIPKQKNTSKCQGFNFFAKSSKQLELHITLYAEFDQQMTNTIDFLDCEKLLFPGVTLYLRLYRSPTNTLLSLNGSDDELGEADKEELDSESVESGDEGPVERLKALEEGLSLLEKLLLLHEDARKYVLSQKRDDFSQKKT